MAEDVCTPAGVPRPCRRWCWQVTIVRVVAALIADVIYIGRKGAPSGSSAGQLAATTIEKGPGAPFRAFFVPTAPRRACGLDVDFLLLR